MTNGNHLSTASLSFIEGLYERYLQDRNSVSADWQQFFTELGETPNLRFEPSFKPASLFHAAERERADFLPGSSQATGIKDRLIQIIRAYRFRGHSIANLDPLGQPRPMPPELQS